jgi:hypothetical protein
MKLAAIGRRLSQLGQTDSMTSSDISEADAPNGLASRQSSEARSRDEELEAPDSFDTGLDGDIDHDALEGTDVDEEPKFQNTNEDQVDNVLEKTADADLEEAAGGNLHSDVDDDLDEHLTDASDSEPEEVGDSLLLQNPLAANEEIDIDVLKYFGDPIDDLEVEDIDQDEDVVENRTNQEAADGTVVTAGLPSQVEVPADQQGSAELNLDRVVEEIISKIKERSLLAEQQLKEEQSPAQRPDFAAFNWKPDIDFFHLDGDPSEGHVGHVFTFEKVTAAQLSSPPAKKRPLQKQKRLRHGPRVQSLDKIYKT